MNGFDFEREVLRVARGLWPGDVAGGPEFVDGRERDGIFHEEDVVHLLEATTERSEEKAKSDCKKLTKLASDLRKTNQDKVVKCWFITLHEPTDRQRAVARGASYPVQVIGFKEFQGKLINAREYLSARDNHRFGSAQNPDSSGRPLKFVPVDVKERSSVSLWSAAKISSVLSEGGKVALTADFGAGKSMLLREIYYRLRDKYLSGSTHQFPVHINLREHSGAQYPDEILERHARIIGFGSASKLVRAWRSGYVILLLDGFDEITSLGFQGKWTKLRDLRYKALAAVRDLVAQQPLAAGVIVAGREFFFDSYSEFRTCLSFHGSIDLTLNDFTESQVAELLSGLGISVRNTSPAWLPKRPLFVATLALRGYLADLTGETHLSVGAGWDALIQGICDRESQISVGLDSSTIRRVLEAVATKSRSQEEAGSLMPVDLTSCFLDICGYAPDEQGVLLLERLPGLAVSAHGGEARSFVDGDFEHALAAGDLCRYFVEPWSGPAQLSATLRPLNSVGVAVSASVLSRDARSAQAAPALERARGMSCLSFDVIQLAHSICSSFGTSASVSDVHIGHFDISGSCESSVKIYFNDCIFDVIDVDVSSDFSKCVVLNGCLVRSVSGIHALTELPKGFYDDRCVFEDVADSASTNAEILDAELPLPVKVMLTVLRKLYFQAGAARRENAFYRGLDHSAQRYVDDVLDILGSEGLATRDKKGGEPLIIPVRSESRRIGAIIASPQASTDPLVVRVRRLID